MGASEERGYSKERKKFLTRCCGKKANRKRGKLIHKGVVVFIILMICFMWHDKTEPIRIQLVQADRGHAKGHSRTLVLIELGRLLREMSYFGLKSGAKIKPVAPVLKGLS